METTIADPKRNSNESHGEPTPVEEWIVTSNGGLITKVERLNRETKERTEVTAEEYAALAASYYAVYYAGIRDYAQALASGDDVLQAYYQGIIQYLGTMGQT